MSKKNILVLIGSPRKGGNTETLANAFIEGTSKNGHTIEKLRLHDHDVNGCLGCDYCMRNCGECVQKDDMQIVFEKISKADIVVLATPLYFFGFSSQMKRVIDRFYALLSGNLLPKQSLLLVAYGSQDDHEIDALVTQYRMTAAALNWKSLGEISAKGALKKGDIANHPALSEAKLLGENIL